MKFFNKTLFLAFLSLFSSPLVGMVDPEDSKKRTFDDCTESTSASTDASPDLKRQKMTDLIAASYGNKYANLARLHDKVVKNKQLNKQLMSYGNYSVEVPAFTGLSDEQGQEFLKKQNVDVAQQWEATQTKMSQTEMQVESPKQTQPTLVTENMLAEKAQKLSDTISKLEANPDAFSNPKMLKLLALKKVTKHADQKLMVRSTGKEDTETVSNAGGNESYANVNPEWATMANATNKVMASYFSQKSIGQRLVEGDQTVTERPIVPVLFQSMIGEKENGADNISQIPVGCVVYTQEPYANTPGVTVIQASWGHNTGVVDNTVAVDTYFVDAENNLNALIKNKPERWIPVNKNDVHTLEKIKNPEEIQNKAVISNQDALAIKSVANAIQKEYGNKPMDIELVFMPHQKKIYLVQARPLKINTQFQPSFLQTLDGIEPENILSCCTVLPADCQLQVVTDKSHVIVANRLNDALTIFTQPNFNKENVKAVLVQGEAETTSHAAAIFRGAGKPVLVVQNIEKINEWLTQTQQKAPQTTQTQIIVDIQRGIVVRTKSDKIIVKNGWFTHPMPKKISIPLFQESEIKKNTQQDAPINYHADKNFLDLVTILKDDKTSVNKTQEILSSILHRINQQVQLVKTDQKDNFKKHIAGPAVAKLEQLYVYAQACAKNIQMATDFMQKLYALHFLECLLFQEEDNLCVGVFSLTSVTKKYNKQVVFIDTLRQKVGDHKAQLILQNQQLFDLTKQGFDCALTSETEDLWINFVAAIASSDQNTQEDFVYIARLMLNLNALSIWINTIFYDNYKKALFNFNDLNSIKTYVNNLIKEVNKSDTFLKFLKDFKLKIQTYDLNNWEDQGSFAQNYANFISEFIQPFETEVFKTTIKEADSKLIKLLALGLMDSLVELFDQSIKRLKGSIQYSSAEEKVKNFKLMLNGYFDLFNAWINILPKEAFKYYYNWPLERYLSKIKEILQSLQNDATQLNPTQSFSVATASIGSTTEFDRNFPEHAEDVFMLIHQNLLITLSSMIKSTLPRQWAKPELFANIEEILLKLNITVGRTGPSAWCTSAWCIGTKFENEKLLVRYNIPLNQHSVIFEITFDKFLNQTLLTTKFVGQARDRWQIIKNFTEILGNFTLKLNFLKIEKNEIILTQEINNQRDLYYLTKSISIMIYTANNISITNINVFKDLITDDILIDLLLERDSNQKKLLAHFEPLLKTEIGQDQTSSNIIKKIITKKPSDEVYRWAMHMANKIHAINQYEALEIVAVILSRLEAVNSSINSQCEFIEIFSPALKMLEKTIQTKENHSPEVLTLFMNIIVKIKSEGFNILDTILAQNSTPEFLTKAMLIAEENATSNNINAHHLVELIITKTSNEYILRKVISYAKQIAPLNPYSAYKLVESVINKQTLLDDFLIDAIALAKQIVPLNTNYAYNLIELIVQKTSNINILKEAMTFAEENTSTFLMKSIELATTITEKQPDSYFHSKLVNFGKIAASNSAVSAEILSYIPTEQFSISQLTFIKGFIRNSSPEHLTWAMNVVEAFAEKWAAQAKEITQEILTSSPSPEILERAYKLFPEFAQQ